MVIGRKHRSSKKVDLKDWMNERIDSSDEVAGPGKCTGTGGNNLTQLTGRKPLADQGSTDDHWHQFTVTRSGRVSRPRSGMHKSPKE